MTRWIAVGAALVSIVAIGFVLLWGTTGRAGTPPFESVVLLLGVVVPLASVLLTWHLWHRGRRASALLAISPFAVMALGVGVAMTWAPLSLASLLWLDLYVLLVFVVIVGRFGRSLLRTPDPTGAVKASSGAGSAA